VARIGLVPVRQTAIATRAVTEPNGIGHQLKTTRILCLADDAVPGGKLAVELQRDAELLNAVDSPPVESSEK